MGCGSFGVAQILVGLYQVGIIGLRDALQKAADSGLRDRETLVDLIIDELAKDNYLPEREQAGYRIALWREYLRFKGEDFSDFFSEVEVEIQGPAGEQRDGFVELTRSVFAEFELTPIITFAQHPDEKDRLLLKIGDDTVIPSMTSRRYFKSAVRKSFSDW